MQHDRLIGLVQDRAQLASRGEAERAVRATLETLGERLPDGLTDNLAGGLPQEVGEHLRRTELLGGMATGERFDRNEFLRRVSDRSGSDPPRAAYLARVVLEVVEEASSGDLMERVRDALPTTSGSSRPPAAPGRRRPDPPDPVRPVSLRCPRRSG